MSDENDEKVLFKPEILSTAKVHSGYLHRIKHYSPCNKCHMTFAIYIPSDEDDFPVGNGNARGVVTLFSSRRESHTPTWTQTVFLSREEEM